MRWHQHGLCSPDEGEWGLEEERSEAVDAGAASSKQRGLGWGGGGGSGHSFPAAGVVAPCSMVKDWENPRVGPCKPKRRHKSAIKGPAEAGPLLGGDHENMSHCIA